MKATKTVISLLLSTIMLFVGCVKDDLDDCPTDLDHNLVLCFEYYDGQRKDIFTERIYAVDVLIYDKNLNLYDWLETDEVITNGTRRKELLLPAGVYYIVSWANNFMNRENKPRSSDGITLGTNLIYHNYNLETGDPLHYAPYLRECWCDTNPEDDDYALYRVEVSDKEVTHHTLSYMSAHRTINVYLKGFDQMLESTEVENPNIAMTNLAEHYNCFLTRNGHEEVIYKKSAEQITVEVKENIEEEFGFATFYVPHFDNASPVTLDITGDKPTRSNSYQYTLDMDYILEELGIEVEDGDDAVIDILVELINGSYVEVKLPSWKVEDVHPGFNVY